MEHQKSPLDMTDDFFIYAKRMMSKSKMHEDGKITPENTYQPAHKENRSDLLEVINMLHLPGSRILGLENLIRLYELAKDGKSCLILSEHLSNLDVPSMFGRFYDPNDQQIEIRKEIFEKIIFVAGVKLNENPLVKLYTEMFSRIVIVPLSSMSKMTAEEGDLASKINRSATRNLVQLRKSGNIFLMFPQATRYRPWKPETAKGIKETFSYMNSFDYFVCSSITGNNMPPREHEDMTREQCLKDVFVLNYGAVQSTKDFINEYTIKSGINKDDKESIKQYIVDIVMDDISKLHEEAENYRKPFLTK